MCISVTLAGSDRFRGFLCQARTDVEDYSTTIGTLGQLGEDVMMGDNCGAVCIVKDKRAQLL